MMEWLDQQLIEAEEQEVNDVYDGGVTLPGEEHEQCHNKMERRKRRRRTAIFIGHGDFMSLVLKRIAAGFGHAVEKEAVPHRSAFVHHNTGITELEYFGNGKFLIMSQNSIPHLSGQDGCYVTGGSLKDGWTYLVPTDGSLDSEVSVAFSDEVQPHIQEQAEALRSLYLSPKKDTTSEKGEGEVTVVVKRKLRVLFVDSIVTLCTIIYTVAPLTGGLQVVGCASLNEQTGRVSSVVVRPSHRRSQVGKSLIEAVKEHAKQSNIEKIVAQPETQDGKEFFQKMGFADVDDGTVAWSSADEKVNSCKL